MTNNVERFHAALTVLAGHGHIKQRLIRAFEDYLVNIHEDEMPIGLKQSFADLRHQMQNVIPSNGEGSICASVRKMSLAEASECAASVVTLYGQVASDALRAKAVAKTRGIKGVVEVQDQLQVVTE